MKLTKIESPDGISFNLNLSVEELVLLEHNSVVAASAFDQEHFIMMTALLGMAKSIGSEELDRLLTTLESSTGMPFDLLRQSAKLMVGVPIPSVGSIMATILK